MMASFIPKFLQSENPAAFSGAFIKIMGEHVFSFALFAGISFFE
jgi:hypothetical protein